MSFFAYEVVSPPAHLPVTVAAADQALAEAVVSECERTILWRAIVQQTRRIVIDGPLPPKLELEPTTSIVSLTRWTPARFPQRKARGRSGAGSEETAEVVDADSYSVVSRDPTGTIIATAPGFALARALERPNRKFCAHLRMAGWTVDEGIKPRRW